MYTSQTPRSGPPPELEVSALPVEEVLELEPPPDAPVISPPVGSSVSAPVGDVDPTVTVVAAVVCPPPSLLHAVATSATSTDV